MQMVREIPLHMRLPVLTAAAFLVAASTAFAVSDEVIDKKLPAKSGGKLVVEVEFGTIEVTGADTNEVTLHATRRVTAGSDEKEREYVAAVPITFTAEGDTIRVLARRGDRTGSGKGKSWSWSWSWGGRSKNEARYTLQVPRHFNVNLDTSGGAISVSDLKGDTHADTSGGTLKFTRLQGPINGDTSGGSITVAECSGAIKIDTSGGHIEVTGSKGELNADTSGGRITVRNFAGDTVVSTSGGSLTLENISGALSGETSGGSIKATLPSPIPGDVKLETSGGSIELSVAANAAFTLDAETSIGSVTSDLPVTTKRSGRDSLRGEVNGGGKSVYLRTSAGSIRVKQSGS